MGLIRLIFKPIGCLFYFVIGLALAVPIFVVLGAWAAGHYSDQWLRMLCPWVEAQTGYTLSFDEAGLSIPLMDFEAQGLRLLNPSHYADPSFLEIGHIRIDADPLSALFYKTFLIHEAELDIERITLVVKPNGQNNLLGFLNAVQKTQAPAPAPVRATPAVTSSPSVAAEVTLQEPPPTLMLSDGERIVPMQPLDAPDTANFGSTETPSKPFWSRPVRPAAPWRIAKLTIRVKNVRLKIGNLPPFEHTLNYELQLSHLSSWDEISQALRQDLLKRLLAPVRPESQP